MTKKVTFFYILVLLNVTSLTASPRPNTLIVDLKNQLICLSKSLSLLGDEFQEMSDEQVLCDGAVGMLDGTSRILEDSNITKEDFSKAQETLLECVNIKEDIHRNYSI